MAFSQCRFDVASENRVQSDTLQGDLIKPGACFTVFGQRDLMIHLNCRRVEERIVFSDNRLRDGVSMTEDTISLLVIP